MPPAMIIAMNVMMSSGSAGGCSVPCPLTFWSVVSVYVFGSIFFVSFPCVAVAVMRYFPFSPRSFACPVWSVVTVWLLYSMVAPCIGFPSLSVIFSVNCLPMYGVSNICMLIFSLPVVGGFPFVVV